ncbi:TPA: hypothetical protein NQI12_000156 [Pseudomonas aeruginosa]|nr:hypothetical protein [Pseudomonas aeruginosa]HCF5561079.1 hypothetical protein [Pseudomonas aeruginosa]HCJ0523934.1 hypothetical protein [Pseudomonas aeruginosa]HCJ4914256.1 hypothetical protein [Pseudomonas aeruginosa]
MAVITSQNPNAEALREFWKSLSTRERSEAARKLDTSVAYLRQVLACGRTPGAVLARDLERVFEARIARHQLRPDLYDVPAGSADLEPILPSDSHLVQCADAAVQASSAGVAP